MKCSTVFAMWVWPDAIPDAWLWLGPLLLICVPLFVVLLILRGSDSCPTFLSPVENEQDFVVEIRDDSIRVGHPNGLVEDVRLCNLERITIESNALGPHRSDVYWNLGTPDGSVRFPLGAVGEDKALDRLGKLRGFDSTRFIAAMSSTESREFIVWTKNKQASDQGGGPDAGHAGG